MTRLNGVEIADTFPMSTGRVILPVAASRCLGVRRITTGNSGGELGPHHVHLRKLRESR